jgi:hypothetical protein
MPSRWLRKGPNKLKKCSERRTDSCSAETDGCCSVIACTYCLEFAGYDGTQFGTAEFPEGGTGWEGTIAGTAFFGYWERNEDGECEFVVTLDGEEVYRKSCYEGQSCRDSSDETAATIGYDTGTLRWIKHEPRPLPTVVDPDTGCRTHFCGDCHCTCRALCVRISGVDAELGPCDRQLEIDEYDDDCEGPSWSGQVTCHNRTFNLKFELSRGPYGECLFGGTIDGEQTEWVEITNCTQIAASFAIYDGVEIDVSCLECGVCGFSRTGCCPNLGNTLYITIDAEYGSGSCEANLITDGEAAIWQTQLPGDYTVTNCNTIDGEESTATNTNLYAVVNCSPEGLYLTIYQGGIGGLSIFSGLYPGCMGGVLTEYDADFFEIGGSCLAYYLKQPNGSVYLST